MIYKLRKKFIIICFISFFATLLVILAAVYLFSTMQTNRMMDSLADIVAENDGVFPDLSAESIRNVPGAPSLINSETPFTTRFFIVSFDSEGKVISVNTESISNVTENEAKQQAETAMKKGRERGSLAGYRYKMYNTENGKSVIFIDGSMVTSLANTMILTVSAVFIGCSLIVLLLIIFISKRVVKPIAESYDKQKQFVSDANHELKTPLTLILTNIDIAESEVGKNEWLDDIRDEGKRMSVLINQLGALARMDEQETASEMSSFNLSDAAFDTVSAFQNLAEQKHLELTMDIASDIHYEGDETEIRRLISTLMDNAIKYCDPNGQIQIGLTMKKRPFIWVENTCTAAGSIPLNRLFDRFYRVEQARTSGSGFGIGLSIAKSIVERHHGKIEAHNVQNHSIRFEVKL